MSSVHLPEDAKEDLDEVKEVYDSSNPGEISRSTILEQGLDLWKEENL